MIKRKKTPVERSLIRPDILIADSQHPIDLSNGSKPYRIEDLGDLPPQLILLIPKEVQGICIPPIQHESSQAQYIIDKYYEGKDRILVCYLPPNSSTSIHHHLNPIQEGYWLLYGEAMLRREEIDPTKKPFSQDAAKAKITEEGLILPPLTWHQVKTGEVGALFVIRMKDAALFPPAHQHIHFQPGFIYPGLGK